MPHSRSARLAGRRRMPRSGGAETGYTLVAMVVIFTVLTIALAAAIPSWLSILKRHKEEELLFRGLQYAEAIRVFQLRFGRLPVRLEELIKVNPRCIRRLWKDPMTENGEWGLIFAQAGGAQSRHRRGTPPQGVTPQAIAPQDLTPPSGLPEPRSGRLGGGADQQRVQAVGPILGVHSRSTESSMKLFFGAGQYSAWKFTADLLPVPVVVPGTENLPRATSAWVGKPLPENLGPLQGGGLQPGPGIRPGQVPGLGQRPGQQRTGSGFGQRPGQRPNQGFGQGRPGGSSRPPGSDPDGR